MEFKKGAKVHLIGIKGAGMTALAGVLKSKGLKVSGSDNKDVFYTDKVLKKLKIPFVERFYKDNITNDIDIVISSTAYYFNKKSLGNREVDEVLKRKIPILTYPEAVGVLSKNYKVIAVAGSHGKSTVTAMLGWVLQDTKIDPVVLVGTKVNKWNSNARYGKGKYLIVEADEYREAFLNYKPFGVIITNIDYDHPDYYKTRDSYFDAFKKLVRSIDSKGWLVVCESAKDIIKYSKAKTLTYGFSPENNLILKDLNISKEKQIFEVMFANKQQKGKISFPGKHQILNSGAVILASKLFNIQTINVIRRIASFPGTERRMQILKKTKDYIVIDDYAHHPTEIQATLDGIRKMYLNREIIVIFQPHMFSRTKALLEDFANSFYNADKVGIFKIFSSARETKGPVGSGELAKKIKYYRKDVTYLKDFKSVKGFIKKHKKNKNVIVLMGAGNVNDLV